MAHFQSPPCFNTFSSFLQEVTNMGGNSIDGDNKENIPPGSCGRLNGNRGGCKRSSSFTGLRNHQHEQQLQHNVLRVADCLTPLKENNFQLYHPQCHTGLTPGNKCTVMSMNRDNSFCINGMGFPFLDDSDMSDTKDNCVFTPTVGQQMVTPKGCGKNSDLFLDCLQAPRLACDLDDGIEVVPLVSRVLHESDDDDVELPRPVEISSKQTIAPPSQQPEFQRYSGPRGLYPSQASQISNNQAHLLGSAWCEAATVSNAEPKRNYTATRVGSGTTPLVAVAGRRVPVDKLHLLLGSVAQEAVEGRTSRDAVNAAPLVPSSRPTPSTAQTYKVIPMPRPAESLLPGSGAAAASATNAQGPSCRRGVTGSQKEMVVIEFGRGNIMRFKPNPAIPPPVVGKRYLVAVRASRSPYDNVAYKDAGICSYVLRHSSEGNGAGSSGSVVTGSGDMERGIFDGSIIRCMDSPEDLSQVQLLASEREAAIVECRKHFKFLNLPFELVDVHYTFDRTICVVYYNIHRQEGTSGHPNVSRLVRTLQFRLKCKVHLKADFCSE